MKNIDYIVLKTAKDLGFPKEKVKQVIDAYWDTVYKRLLGMESTTIMIRNVGLITVSKFKLRRFILILITRIRNIKTNPKFSEADRKKLLPLYYDKLRKALKERDVIAKKYAEKFNNI